MNHDMPEHLGTFWGHILPGALFIVWALWWLLGRDGRAFRMTLEHIVVIVLTVAGAIGELWWASWRMTDSSVINYQHATMYITFAAAAVVDLMAKRGQLPANLPRFVLALAFGGAGSLFAVHGSHMPVSGSIHHVLAAFFYGAMIACFVNDAARAWLTMAVGTWFIHAAFMLYGGSYDLMSGAVVMRVHLFAAWHLMATGVIVLAALGRRRVAGV